MGRYFQAPTLKEHRSSQYKNHDPREGGVLGGDRSSAIDCAMVEMSYVPLMDIVSGRKSVRKCSTTPPPRGFQSFGGDEQENNDRRRARNWEEREVGDGLRHREATTSIFNDNGKDNNNDGGDDDDDYDDNEEDDDSSDDRCYVSVGRIRAARVAVIEAADGLGRPPLFLAAAAGAIPVAKILIRRGADSALAVDGTGLTPYAVAPSLTMRRVLAAEARQSLYRAISEQAAGGPYPADDANPKMTHNGGGENDECTQQHARLEEVGDGTVVAGPCCDMTHRRRMEMWVSTLAEEEFQSTGRSSEVRSDQKSSLHLAAFAGLPNAVNDLLGRGVGEPKDGIIRCRSVVQGAIEEFCSVQPTWTTAWKPCNNLVGSSTRILKTGRHRAPEDHRSSSQQISKLATLKTDANGWSALHACCAGSSPQHYSCALALLGSQADPNAQTNTGKTPLHVAAASACGSAEHRNEVSSTFAFFFKRENNAEQQTMTPQCTWSLRPPPPPSFLLMTFAFVHRVI